VWDVDDGREVGDEIDPSRAGEISGGMMRGLLKRGWLSG